MELQIESKRYNPLLKRTEIHARIVHKRAATPSREDVRNLIASEFGVSKDLVIVHHIRTGFGWTVSKVYAKIYDTLEDLKRVEPEHILRKHGLIQEEVKEGV
ncbi:MAG: 30S ribosomal protein S24e [Thermoplasmata archaeon]|nr:30S ribosomal protein S24e [Euryarchaeota archaeon]RLF64826.1 MAG: 30S ribosomal protein S24e [Thermoplasmata archaeon]